MTREHYGYVTVNGERHKVNNVDVGWSVSDVEEVYGIDFRECDECGEKTHPKDLIFVASTRGLSGVFCRGCRYDE